MSKRLVVVTGATGKQGGSVVNALLEHGGYEIRAVSRDVDSASAKTLADNGVEVVAGHLGDKESLVKAFKDAYAVFGVSIPEFVSKINEVVQGQNLTDACKENSVSLLVWSSLPSCSRTSNGKYPFQPFDDKEQVEKYIKSVGQPAIVFRTGGFTENLVSFGILKRDEQDPSKYHCFYNFVPGDSPLPSTYAGKDVGPVVVAAIDKWDEPAWRAELSKEPIPLVSYQMTGNEIAKTIAKVTGKDVDCVTLYPENIFPIMKNMNLWLVEQLWGYGDKIPVDILLRLGVKLHTLEDYVREVVVPWMNAQK